jgi:hypothetical protein
MRRFTLDGVKDFVDREHRLQLYRHAAHRDVRLELPHG